MGAITRERHPPCGIEATLPNWALRELDQLMDAMPGTARGDRLDVLATLVKAYENEHWRIDASDLIDAIKIRMDERGPTRRDVTI